MKKLKKFFFGAGMFVVLSIAAKAIGVFYRLPLINILGAEGMGLYQMVFPLYSLILAALSGGIPAAVSKNVSELVAEGREKDAARTLHLCLAMLMATGIVSSVLLYIFRSQIASLQGNAAAGAAYAAIAPAVVFSCLIACIRGYFQGYKNMLPSGISQMVEQIIKVAAGLTFASAFLPRGIEYGVFGALLGVSISEVAAFVYLIVRFSLWKRARTKKFGYNAATRVIVSSTRLQTEAAADALTTGKEKIKKRTALKRIAGVAMPVTLGSLIIPLSQAVDSFLVVNLLTKSGVETTLATSLYGLFNGPVGSLLNMPTVVTVALAASLLPAVASGVKKGVGSERQVFKCVDAYLFVMLPCAAVFFIAPYPLLGMLYSGGLTAPELSIAADLLRIEAVDIVMLGLIQLTSAIMQGMNKSKIPVLNLLAGATLKAVVSALLLPTVGIYGAAIGNVVCYCVTGIADAIWTRKIYGRFFAKRHLKLLAVSAVFAGAMCLYYLFELFMNDIIAFVCAAVIAFAAYLTLIIKTKCILLREMLS